MDCAQSPRQLCRWESRDIEEAHRILGQFDTQRLIDHFRSVLESRWPTFGTVDYSAMYRSFSFLRFNRIRSGVLSRFDHDELKSYEEALIDIGIHPKFLLAWTATTGYVFGATIYGLAAELSKHNDLAECDRLASAGGLAVYFHAIYDRLLDDEHERFGGLLEEYPPALIHDCLVNREFSALVPRTDEPVLSVTFALYRQFLEFCSTISERNAGAGSMIARWRRAVFDLHLAQIRSTYRAMTIPPWLAGRDAFEPSKAGYRMLAAAACLPHGVAAYRELEPFVTRYARVTWVVDDVTDLKEDLRRGVWSGVSAAIISEGLGANHAMAFIDSLAIECAGILDEMRQRAAGITVVAGNDRYAAAEHLWAVIWGWLGGEIRPFHFAPR